MTEFVRLFPFYPPCRSKTCGAVIGLLFLLVPTGCFAGLCGSEPSFRAKAASQAEQTDSIPDLSAFFWFDPECSYAAVRKEIAGKRAQLSRDGMDLDSVGNVFSELLVYKLIPYWYGTPWDFNGYTAVPRSGTVACGYFVSTTLLHMGLNLNRYKLAQQLPVHEAKSLALSDTVLEFEAATTSALLREIGAKTTTGVYFLGFDQSHVGFLYVACGQLFAIHANYIGAEGVTVEPLGSSQAFASYRHFYVAPLSTNKSLMTNWLNQGLIPVIVG